MFWMFLGLLSFVVFILFLIIGIVAAIRKKNAKWNFLISLAAFVVLIVAVIASPDQQPAAVAEGNQASPAKAAAQQKANAEAKASQEPENAAEDHKHSPVSAPAQPAEEVKPDPASRANEIVNKYFESGSVKFDETNGFLEITAAGSDNFTVNLIRQGMLMKATNTLKDLRSVPEVTDVAFNITFPMVDKYGNESQDVVMKINVTAGTRAKINFDNFDFRNLPDVADSYWQHPAFSR